MLASGAWAALAHALPSAPEGAHGAVSPHGYHSQGGLLDDDELEALVAAERAEVRRLLLVGDTRGAQRMLSELLEGDPEDGEARALLARLEWMRARHGQAERAARRALAAGDVAARREAALVLLEHDAALGRASGVDARFAELTEAGIAFEGDAQLLFARAHLLSEVGRRAEAQRDLQAATNTAPQDWRGLLARARARRALFDLMGASRDLVAAERAAREAGDGAPADLLAELADVYFEADGEVDDPRTARRAPGPLFRQALGVDAGHAPALLGLFELGRFNWRRSSTPPGQYLDRILGDRPDHVEALLAATDFALADGQLPATRARLARLERLAPERRAVRTLRAALHWVEHERDQARAVLAELAAVDPEDGRPEREVGRLLLELYRFQEGAPFLQAAVERDPRDWRAWTELGRALGASGDVPGALAALRRAEEVAAGRRNAWRSNSRQVLEVLEDEYVLHRAGDLTFAWMPDEGPVLERYLVPFYAEAREELAQRYGYRSGPVRIEVFRRHADFSVRSTGFEGFPALGVCFGPVVTAVSPIAEVRGQFSWARTSYHEFTHVVHLGISNNRCPRWITEGLATWEEVERNPAWTRNMRRELIDARANRDLIPLRELNRAFRGPRVIFAYYQGGLICRMLVESHGFPAMVRVLEAFDRGEDLDGALRSVFGLTPEEIDQRLAAFVDTKLANLHLEARWREEHLALLRLELTPEPPADPVQRRAWQNSHLDLAFGSWQAGRRVDAQEALRRLERAGEVPARAEHLRGMMAFAAQDREAAEAHWRRFLAGGGEDFRVRTALAGMAAQAGRTGEAREHFEAAERAFPGYPEAHVAAELTLATLLERQGDVDGAMAARERWIAYNADALDLRLMLARWHREAGRHDRAAELYLEANEIDPFLRGLHLEWAESLEALGDQEGLVRELEVALLVPPELDPSSDGPLGPLERAEVLGRVARALGDLGRGEEARARALEALALDPLQSAAREAMERLE